jgi:hypothetical protein
VRLTEPYPRAKESSSPAGAYSVGTKRRNGHAKPGAVCGISSCSDLRCLELFLVSTPSSKLDLFEESIDEAILGRTQPQEPSPEPIPEPAPEPEKDKEDK